MQKKKLMNRGSFHGHAQADALSMPKAEMGGAKIYASAATKSVIASDRSSMRFQHPARAPASGPRFCPVKVGHAVVERQDWQ